MPPVHRGGDGKSRWRESPAGICRGETGQAAAELVAILPLVGLAAVLCFHLALAGWGLWSAAEAARVGARASAVDLSARRRAVGALPGILREHAKVEVSEGRTRVSVSVPTLLPGLDLPRLSAVAGPLEADA